MSFRSRCEKRDRCNIYDNHGTISSSQAAGQLNIHRLKKEVTILETRSDEGEQGWWRYVWEKKQDDLCCIAGTMQTM